jgi:hypothetical protein
MGLEMFGMTVMQLVEDHLNNLALANIITLLVEDDVNSLALFAS